MTQSRVYHAEQVRDFYYNVEFMKDGSLNTVVGNRSFHLNEERQGEILGMNCVGIQKKLIKGDYQLLFEFVNKVVLPRSEKRIVASTANLFIMDPLCKLDLLNLPALILEHMYKMVVEKKG
ncbi:hypothetical protein R3W88_026888 [Solanum pinnatisectum]|uniref:Uncharacterized protein n=1 Tax=Solanum pinnatisectum TaxID=50273 RepID=A0AAV9LFG6_9SOLN|nr:hypothetical protein R3W88_026888 [Solanum pinnatisectum]